HNLNTAYQLLILNYYDRRIIDAVGIKFNCFFLASQIGYGERVDKFNFEASKLEGVCAGAAVYSSKSLLKLKEKDGYYFDPNFFVYYEDVDLSLRLCDLNNNFSLIKNAKVFHHHSGTGIQDSPFKTFYLTRNLFLYTKKNVSKFHYFLLRIIYVSIALL